MFEFIAQYWYWLGMPVGFIVFSIMSGIFMVKEECIIDDVSFEETGVMFLAGILVGGLGWPLVLLFALMMLIIWLVKLVMRKK